MNDTKPSETKDKAGSATEINASMPKSMTGCMLCGKPLEYLKRDRPEPCVFCNKTLTANAVCEDGHFVCDDCHGSDMIEVAKHICTTTNATDMIDLLNQLRSHPLFPLHGPDHHFSVPGVILACYRNSGGSITDEDIITAIDRGKSVPGGACGFLGTCGAVLGVGIAFGIIFKSSPLTAKPRQKLQHLMQAVLAEQGKYESARCCQRETWTALEAAAALSKEHLQVELKAEGDVKCRQQKKNKECILKACPYFK